MDTLPRLNFTIHGFFDYGSNVANNQLINNFIFGGKISREQKDNLFDHLNKINSVGGDFNSRVQLEIPKDTFFGKTNFSLVFGFEHVEHFDAKIASDLVRLIFDGNRQFAGAETKLGGTNMNYLNYQQINFGFINYKKSKGKAAQEGVVFAIIKAQQHQALTISRGSLFTEHLGNELVVDLSMVYNSSDTANTGFKAFNGFGISTDFFTEFNLNNGDKILVNIDDLGFIQWNKKSLQINSDSAIMFDGIQIDNIFEIGDSAMAAFSQDTLMEYLYTNKKNGSYAIALPTTVSLSYSHFLSEKLRLNLSLHYKILANYYPMISAKIQYKLTTSFVVESNLVYGGYGKFNAGAVIAKQFKNKCQIIVGAEHLGSFLFPKATYSNNGFIGLKMYF